MPPRKTDLPGAPAGSLLGTQWRATLTALSPFLSHFDNIEIEDWKSRQGTEREANVPGDDRHPADLWKQYLYQDGEHITLPFNNLSTCLMTAGKKISLPRNRSLKEPAVRGILLLTPHLVFKNRGEAIKMSAINAISGLFAEQAAQVRELGFFLDVRGVTNPGTGKRNIRVRPRFDQWEIVATFSIEDEIFTIEMLQQLWDLAGRSIGLGDWRPGCSGRQKIPGPYGRFTVKLERL